MTVIKHKAQRVVVLIDVQNMYHSAKNLYGARVNFKEVVRSAVAGRELVRAIAYVIRTESGEEKSFIEALAKIGIETHEKDLQIFAGGAKKADWDVGMSIDAVRFSETFVNPALDYRILNHLARNTDTSGTAPRPRVIFKGGVNTIVLVTGDGDFVPLVEYLKAKGIQVEVMAFGRSASGKLKEATDDFIDLGEDPKKYLMRMRKIT